MHHLNGEIIGCLSCFCIRKTCRQVRSRALAFSLLVLLYDFFTKFCLSFTF
jgi:hypothetical protein